MLDPMSELKARADILHSKIERGDAAAIARLRVLPEFRKAKPGELENAVASIQRRHCLSVIAIEMGFTGWQHATALIAGTEGVDDFGTTLYPKGVGGHLNNWYRTYDEAAERVAQHGGYLLAHRRDFFVVEAPFIESLGLDPLAPEWKRMGYDWVRPTDMAARTQLYGKLIAGKPREAALS
jgi:hypothetical protein